MTPLFFKSWYIYPGFWLLFCSLTISFAHAKENISDDSLRSLVQTSMDIQSGDPQRAISLASLALHTDVAGRAPALLLDVHMVIADSYFDLSEIDSAILHYQKASQIAKGKNDPEQMARGYNGLGNSYYYIGNAERAWKYYEKSLQIAVDSDLTERLPIIYNNLGNILMDRDSDQKALEYYQKARDFAVGPLYKAHFCNNIGLCYQKMDSLDVALTWYEKSKEIYDQIGEKRYLLTPLYNIALIQFDKKEYDNAESSYLDMVDECLELDLKEDLIFIYNRLGLIYNLQGKHHKALHYHKKCIELAKETNFRNTSIYYLDIAKTYDSLGNHKEALFYIKKHNALKDSLNSIEKEKAISELITRYEAKEKSAEINRLEVEKENLEMKARQEAFVRKSVITVALLVFILILIFLILYRKKLIIERQMTKHKEEASKRLEAEKRHQNEIDVMKVSIESQEKEKQRIASHLHDSVAGTLAGIKHSLGNLSEHSTDNLKLALRYVDNAYQEVSTLSNHLSHLPSIETNFLSFLRRYCEDVSELNHIEISFKAIRDEEMEDLNQKLKQELFSILREAINNIIKHARASHVAVCVSQRENVLILTIKDNGIGFVTSEIKGLGLTNMQSRVDLMSGTMKLNTAPGQGAEISIEIPKWA